jgi:alpha/beta superfamily hydrolase
MAEVIFPGPEGRLEGRYHHNPEKNSPIAVVLHPHPLYGGTMNNKIVYRLYASFARAGFSVLRFNFRGVGRSVGKFDDGLGEMTDAATALDWVQLQNPDSTSVWIAGFSFGAWISLQLLMRRPEIEGFLAVSPPANMYDFGFLSPCPASGLITQGDRDDIVNEQAVANFVEKMRAQKGTSVDYRVIQGADHYYRQHLDQLTEICDQYIVTKLEEFKTKPRLRPDRKRRQLPADIPA